MNFYKIIKKLRSENDLSAKDVAKRLGLTTNIVYEWEHQRCEPSLDSLVKLSQIFEVSVGYLIGVEDDFGNVVVKNPDDVNLTKDEQTVLDCFRELGPFEREAILIQIKALAGTVKESIKK